MHNAHRSHTLLISKSEWRYRTRGYDIQKDIPAIAAQIVTRKVANGAAVVDIASLEPAPLEVSEASRLNMHARRRDTQSSFPSQYVRGGVARWPNPDSKTGSLAPSATS